MLNSPDPATPACELVVRGQRVVIGDALRPAALLVRGGCIAAVAGYDEVPAGAVLVDAGDAIVLPGLVDTHVHVNDPGRTEWEGFETATRAAVAGGVTTLIDMPLNAVPPTTTLAGLEAKLERARGRCAVDVGFWGGLVPGNHAELRPLWAAGVFGFKCFLAPSGVDEFPAVGEEELRRAMPILAELGAPLLVHAELPAPLEAAARAVAGLDPRHYASYLASRPDCAETEAVELLVRLCRDFSTRMHVVHLSSAAALPILLAAREEGLPISVETCPHYLHFLAEDVPNGATELKCAPPIRGRENRDRLWSALGVGLIDLIATDHSPCPPRLKRRESGDFFAAWGGIASLQLGLSAVWHEARERGYTPQHLARWMAAAPASLAGLYGRKGALAVGCDADLVIWNPDAEYLVQPSMLRHRHDLSPYVGSILPGVVEATFLRGEQVYAAGDFAAAPSGRILRRPYV